jgi:site-specific recombinase XerD
MLADHRPSHSDRSERVVNPLMATIPLYLAFLERQGRSQHTLTGSRLDLAQLGRFVGKQRLDLISPHDLRGFFAWLVRQQGNRPSSIRRKTSTVKKFFQFLVTQGIVPSDPSERLAYPALATDSSAILTLEQAEAVIGAATQPSWRVLIGLLRDCGLKRDEVVALRWDDVELDPPSPRVHVRHRADSKRTRRRTLALPDRVANAIKSMPCTDGRLLDLSARGVDFIVETCGRRAGVENGRKVTPQMLRDTFALERVAAFRQIEQAIEDQSSRLMRIREHDRILLRELGLSDHSIAAARYRTLLERAEPNRPEQPPLIDPHPTAPDELEHR